MSDKKYYRSNGSKLTGEIRARLEIKKFGGEMKLSGLPTLWNKLTPENLELSIAEFHSHKRGPFKEFSNWYPSNFYLLECTANGNEEQYTTTVFFNSGEQAIMAVKAVIFNDVEAYKALTKNDQITPKECKEIGRGINNFSDKDWVKSIIPLIARVLYHKFKFDEELRDKLLSTGDKIIAEMTSEDDRWGTGVNSDDIRANNPSEWPGLNVLGYILMLIRHKLNEEESLHGKPSVYEPPVIMINTNNGLSCDVLDTGSWYK
jgi:ribA/ribD-fused uncharacterized protein